jgi:abortive infection bacteriophage resistance protein
MTFLAKKILGCKDLKTFWNSNGKQNTFFLSRSNSLLLKQRGLIFDNEQAALLFRKHKLLHFTLHTFKHGNYFEDIIERYNFDRQLR